MTQEKISTGASALAQMTLKIFDNGVRIGTTTFSPRDAWTYQANGQEEGEPRFTAKAGALTSNAWVIQVNPAPSMRQCHLSRKSRPPVNDKQTSDYYDINDDFHLMVPNYNMRPGDTVKVYR